MILVGNDGRTLQASWLGIIIIYFPYHSMHMTAFAVVAALQVRSHQAVSARASVLGKRLWILVYHLDRHEYSDGAFHLARASLSFD